MALSPYVMIYADPERPGSLLVYSTKKGSVVRLSERLLAAARDGALDGEELETLRRLAIVVDDPAAERGKLAGLIDRNNARSAKFKATVVLTLDCNLACPYCFEGNFRGNYAMDEATAAQLVDRVTREQIGAGREVEIRFYGGEPLMALGRLRSIAGQLQAAAAAAGTRFSCSMVTNATLLTRPIVEELVPLGLTSVQITLDGPPEIHDRQRPFVSGKGSFAAIVANLKDVWDLVTLKPGGNFTRENFREFPRLLDILLAEGLAPEKFGPALFAPVLPKSGPRVGQVPDLCMCSSEPWLIDASLFLREECLKRGFAVEKVAMGACPVELENCLVVNYDGSLYKCPNFMGWPELSVGTLADGVKEYRTSHALDCWRNDKCHDCAYLPLCFGGCRLVTLMKQGSIDGVDCRKPFYDAALESIVLQDLRYQ